MALKLKTKKNWQKIVTRELPLLIIFYSNEMYLKSKKILGFDFKHGLVINKNGIIERYIDKEELKKFYIRFKKMDHDILGNIIKKAFDLDCEITKLINKLSANLNKIHKKDFLIDFLEFNKKFANYWGYYLAVYYMGMAVDNVQWIKIFKKYKKEIEVLRGEKAIRMRAETIFFKNFLVEIEKETKIDNSLLFFCFPNEIVDFIKFGKKISKNALKERKRHYVWFMDNGQEKYYFSNQAKKIESREIKSDDNILNVSKIKGVAASRGVIRGKAKIIFNRNQLDNVKKGDILVAPMTTPWYMPAMKRAFGFVTDEGGVTCHAAIIAREMNKPCIIGTKIATKVLKSGDLIEVDADKGVVKIIKRVKR